MLGLGKIRKTVIAAIAAVILLAGAAGVVYASDAAVPGKTLYPVDRAWEQVVRTMTFNQVRLAEYEMAVLDERLEELEAVSEEGDLEDIEEAADNVDEQQDRVRERVQEMVENNDIDEGEKNRVTNRYENQYENNYEKMEQVRDQVQERENFDEGEGAVNRVMESYRENYEDYQGGDSGNSDGQGEQNQNGR